MPDGRKGRMMTDQYQQENINDQDNPSALEISSFDFRQVPALIPAGTTATMQRVKIPGIVVLTQLSWASILAPTGGQEVELRLFRIRPASNPAGFGFIQLASTVTISAANFPDPGGNIDISDQIFDGPCLLPNEYVACSWVHTVGGNTMQPLNMNWNFVPIGVAPPEPPATTTVYADVFG